MKHKTLYYGGHIITCNLRDEVAEALVIEDEKILYVGSYETARYLIDADTEIIHIGGRAIIPTFTDSMCGCFAHFPASEAEAKNQIEALWERAVQSGITCICDGGKGGENAISSYQILLNQKEGIPLRCLSLISDNPTHEAGTLATCLSACGIRTGMGNDSFKIGFVRMPIELPKDGKYTLNSPFALFLNHLLSRGLSVQFEPKNKAEAEYALWCTYCIREQTSSSPSPRICLPFAIESSLIDWLKKTGCHVVMDACALLSYTASFADFSFDKEAEGMPGLPQNLGILAEADIPFSFANFLGKNVTCSPMEILAEAVFGDDLFLSHKNDENLSLQTALRALTLHGAMGALQANICGSLEWGKSADFLLLSASPFGKNKREVKAIHPLRVVLRGKTVYDTSPLLDKTETVYVPTNA